MKFGKLQDISQVDFSLPNDAAGTKTLLQSINKASNSQTTIYIGCTGWSMKEWLGKVYPTNTKAKDMLKVYGTQFNTIELNTTHYRIPTPETIMKWKMSVPADFRFCPKIPQSISHSRSLAADPTLVQQFCESIALLDTKLGSCFLQLPPYFSKFQLHELRHFLERFPANIPLAIEFRHQSWFEDGHFEEAAKLLESLGRATVITDVAGRRDVLHQRLTTDIAMIRFVGNALVASDYTRIDAWVKRLKEWAAAGLSTIYLFVHEPDNTLAPDLAIYLMELLQAEPSFQLRGPTILSKQDIPKQGSLF